MSKETQPVKISKEIYEKVRINKEKTGVSIIRFIEDSVLEKIERIKCVKGDI